MHSYKNIFIESAYECGALQFGEFTLNSGRTSPFFFNTGMFSSGKAINAIANAYVDTIIKNDLQFDMLFGPAYKGIPLITAISQVLYQRKNLSVPFSFNRKEKNVIGSAKYSKNIIFLMLTGRYIQIRRSIHGGLIGVRLGIIT